MGPMPSSDRTSAVPRTEAFQGSALARFFRRFGRTFSVSTSTMLVYRGNLLFFFAFEALFLTAQFLTVSVGFDLAGGGDVAGWTRREVYVLTAVNGLSHQLFICFFINPIFNLALQVWNGQFDYLLLKPVNPLQSMFFHGQFAISNLPTMVVNLIVVIGLIAGSDLAGDGTATAAQLLGFALFFAIGLAVRVALGILCMAPVFLSERLNDVEDGFWSLSTFAKYPLSVYPRTLQLGLTFFLPLGMVAALPSEILFKAPPLGKLAAALASSFAFIAISVLVFKVALRRYQSVNAGV